MKQLLLAVFAALLFSTSLQAQERREIKPKDNMRAQQQQVGKQLNLTDSQKVQRKAVQEDFQKKMQELEKNESITVREYRDRKEALLKARKQDMEKMLSAEQKNKLTQMKAAETAKKEEQFAKHLDKMKKDLALTDAQVTQLKIQRENVKKQMMALKENEAMTREQKKAQMIELKKEAKSAHDKIFTEAQLNKIEERKKKRPDQQSAK